MWFGSKKNALGKNPAEVAENLYLAFHKVFQNQRIIMAAIETANTNLEQLKTDVTALLAKPAGVPEAQVQAIADAIAALDVTVKAAL